MVCATTVRQPVIGPENALSPMPPFNPHGPSQELKPHLTSATATIIQDMHHGKSQLLRDQSKLSCPQHQPTLPGPAQKHNLRVQPCPKGAELQEKFGDVLEVYCNFKSYDVKDLISDDVNVKGRLKEHSQFWNEIGASSTVMSIIIEGYRIPFAQQLPSMFLNNNKSAMLESSFVEEEILKLLKSGRITEKIEPSYVVSPLTVAFQASGKKRLILDLSKLNKYLTKTRFKMDDWKLGLQFLSSEAHLFTFDLKSGYHHIDIATDHQKYLGFSWEVEGIRRFFEFSVLPFGLSSAPLIFTKVMKPLVTHWRASGIFIALYLDDGFCVVPKSTNNHDFNLAVAREVSRHVQVDLLRAGLIYNIQKSNWIPTTRIDWLGMTWDTVAGTLQVVQRRIDKICLTIQSLKSSNYVTIRKLHSLVGQVISLSPVVGNISRLTTRHCQIEIAKATHEDNRVRLDEQCMSEITFWENNLPKLNVRKVFAADRVCKIACCDASAIGSGAIICNDIHTAHKQWTEIEAKKSSTWRELDTIFFAICSFLPIISNSQLKIFTDSQAAARIVEVGSMNLELQQLSQDIFHTCLNNNIILEVDWIPRSKNEQADFISRLIDIDDWEISPGLFQIINDTWGPFTTDCFACYYNTKLPRFFSRFWNPGSTAVDAFAQNWANENCLLVPPVVLIPSVLKHLYSCKSKGALVFPWWPSSPFWPILWSCYKAWIKEVITVDGFSALQLGRNKNSLLGSKNLNSLVCVAYIDCTN